MMCIIVLQLDPKSHSYIHSAISKKDRLTDPFGVMNQTVPMFVLGIFSSEPAQSKKKSHGAHKVHKEKGRDAPEKEMNKKSK